MATRVIVQRICDGCGHDGDEKFTTSLVITMNRVEYEVDVCDLCRATNTVLVNMRQVKGGKTPGRKPRIVDGGHVTLTEVRDPNTEAVIKGYSGRPRIMACGEKGCSYMGPDLRSVNMHKSKEHGIKAASRK
jgi:hypothetical protein